MLREAVERSCLPQVSDFCLRASCSLKTGMSSFPPKRSQRKNVRSMGRACKKSGSRAGDSQMREKEYPVHTHTYIFIDRDTTNYSGTVGMVDTGVPVESPSPPTGLIVSTERVEAMSEC